MKIESFNWWNNYLIIVKNNKVQIATMQDNQAHSEIKRFNARQKNQATLKSDLKEREEREQLFGSSDSESESLEPNEGWLGSAKEAFRFR